MSTETVKVELSQERLKGLNALRLELPAAIWDDAVKPILEAAALSDVEGEDARAEIETRLQAARIEAERTKSPRACERATVLAECLSLLKGEAS